MNFKNFILPVSIFMISMMYIVNASEIATHTARVHRRIQVGSIASQSDIPCTAFIDAAKKGDTKTMQKLYEQERINVNAASDKENALQAASSSGHANVITYLLSLPGIDINKRGCHGRTPLMHAAIGSHLAAFSSLLADPKIDILARDFFSASAYSYALQARNPKMVAAFMERLNILTEAAQKKDESGPASLQRLESFNAHKKEVDNQNAPVNAQCSCTIL